MSQFLKDFKYMKGKKVYNLVENGEQLRENLLILL